MPRSGFALDGPTPDKPLWDRVRSWMNENAPGVVDAVSSAADTMLGPKNPPVNMALRGMGELMRRGDPMNVMGGPAAMTLAHGTPAVWAAEAGAPLGQARRAFARTGEGAAVKGEGLYAAERGSTGEAYRTALAEKRAVEGAKVKGQPWDVGAEHPGDPIANVNDSLVFAMTGPNAMTAERAIADTRAKLRMFRGDNPDWYRKAEEHLNSISPSDLHVPAYSPGSLYALDYPDELLPRTLDFDAPLSTQTPEVRAALEKAGLRAGRTATVVDRGVDIRGRQNGFEMHVTGPTGAVEIHGPYYDKSSAENAAARINSPGAWDDPRGEDLYKALVNKFGGQGSPEAAEKASRFLADAGIPGHKFFDQGSRMEGEGTRNFVVYDPDKTLKTLGRYPNLEEFLKAHPEVPR
jgi:hypothetical protein